MVCIYCGNKTAVVNSRPSKKAPETWRRRSCSGCKALFTSREIVDLSATHVVRNNKTQRPFDRNVLFVSMYQSCGHRPNAAQEADALTQTIITKLLQLPGQPGVLPKETIIHTAKEVLQRFDPIAATYYKAYYDAA